MDTFKNKFISSLTKGIGVGVREGFKGITELNYGQGQKDFFKDLGNTIKESLKNAKFKMPSGGGGGHDDHGGGHDDHGGGHH
jgi:hypothetical protein